MSEFDEFMSEALGESIEAFGTESFTVEGFGDPFQGFWNDLGRTEVLEINGRRVSFSVLVEAARSQFTQIPKHGLLVTRVSDGATYRITGEVQVDQLTVRFALDSRHK